MAETAAIFAVLGAGSWGTALALLLARKGIAVRLWDIDSDNLKAMATDHCNARYLPNIKLDAPIQYEANLAACLQGASDCLVVVPSKVFRATLERIVQTGSKPSLVWATKGIDPQSNKLLHEVAAEVMGADQLLAVLSGPTFALEVARELPTAVTIASSDAAYSAYLSQQFHSSNFRVYTSNDMVGVGLGGAVKNVLAIAAGISDGLGYGANARAALVTRGLAEIMRLGLAMGGQRETFMGLAGIGDLVLTATDNQSRNRRFGLALGRGSDAAVALDEIGQVVEGLETAREVVRLAAHYAIDMPIVMQVYRILHEGLAARDAVKALLLREPKAERSH